VYVAYEDGRLDKEICSFSVMSDQKLPQVHGEFVRVQCDTKRTTAFYRHLDSLLAHFVDFYNWMISKSKSDYPSSIAIDFKKFFYQNLSSHNNDSFPTKVSLIYSFDDNLSLEFFNESSLLDLFKKFSEIMENVSIKISNDEKDCYDDMDVHMSKLFSEVMNRIYKMSEKSGLIRIEFNGTKKSYDILTDKKPPKFDEKEEESEFVISESSVSEMSNTDYSIRFLDHESSKSIKIFLDDEAEFNNFVKDNPDALIKCSKSFELNVRKVGKDFFSLISYSVNDKESNDFYKQQGIEFC